jgi:hypothetical protein
MQTTDQRAEAPLPLRGRQVDLRREMADVAAGHEVPAGTAHDDAADRRVHGERGGLLHQRIHHRRIEGIERIGTIERQRRDRSVAVDEKGRAHDAVADSTFGRVAILRVLFGKGRPIETRL